MSNNTFPSGFLSLVTKAAAEAGFKVESLAAFKSDLDELMESRPDLFPAGKKGPEEDSRMLEILAAGCKRGEMQLHDPDGWLLDVSEV